MKVRVFSMISTKIMKNEKKLKAKTSQDQSKQVGQ
jgi:hypothetical protein